MNFEEALVEGARRNLNPAARQADLQKLCSDGTFPSLLGLIAEMKQDAVRYVCDEVTLANSGLTSRAGGQLSALEELENRLGEIHGAPSGVAARPAPTSVGAAPAKAKRIAKAK